jgi:hypothetical protein
MQGSTVLSEAVVIAFKATHSQKVISTARLDKSPCRDPIHTALVASCDVARRSCYFCKLSTKMSRHDESLVLKAFGSCHVRVCTITRV